MADLWERLKALGRHRWMRSVAVLVGGTAMSQLLLVVALPLLTRLYTPADFGVLAVYTSVAGVLAVAASGRYESAILLPEDEAEAYRALVVALLTLALSSLLVGVGTSFLGEALCTWARAEELAPWMGLLPVGMAALSAQFIFIQWATRVRSFRPIALSRVAGSVGTVALQGGLGLVGTGAAGLLAGDILGRGLTGGILGALSQIGWRRLWASLSWRGLAETAWRYRRFPLLSSGASLVNTAATLAPSLFLAPLYNLEIAGLYNQALRVLLLPVGLVSAAVGQVYTGDIARLAREEPAGMSRIFRKMLLRLFLICIAPTLVVGALGPWLFALAFGEVWREAGVYAQVLAPVLLANFLATPIGSTLDVLERQDLQIIREGVRGSLVAGALVTAWLLEPPTLVTVAMISAANTLGYGFHVLIAWLAIHQAIRRGSAPKEGT